MNDLLSQMHLYADKQDDRAFFNPVIPGFNTMHSRDGRVCGLFTIFPTPNNRMPILVPLFVAAPEGETDAHDYGVVAAEKLIDMVNADLRTALLRAHVGASGDWVSAVALVSRWNKDGESVICDYYSVGVKDGELILIGKFAEPTKAFVEARKFFDESV